MREIRNFVVRIYRRDGRHAWGVVEDVQAGCSNSFHSADHLWQVLASPDTEIPTEKRKPK